MGDVMIWVDSAAENNYKRDVFLKGGLTDNAYKYTAVYDNK